jgi:broad specificity phosphatase PhoE
MAADREPVYEWSELVTRLTPPIALRDPVELHLLRHGRTTANARGLVSGKTNVFLDPEGVRQAVRAGRELAADYDLVYHSYLRRTLLTLRYAKKASRAKFGRVIADRRLNERSLGDLERKPAVRIDAYAKGDLGYAPPGGESYAAVARRVLSFLADAARLAGETHARLVLVCGHAGPMRIILGVLDEATDPAAVLAPLPANATLVRRTWRRLTVPPFLDAVAGKPYRHPVVFRAHT